MGEFSGMWEGIIMSLIFVVLLTAVLGHFNSEYGQDNSIGLDTSGLDNFRNATQSAYDETGGEVTQSSDGLTLTSSWNMAKGIFSTMWSFINGSWIQTLIVDVLKMDGTEGYLVAGGLRLLFLGMLIFGLIKLFFKVAA